MVDDGADASVTAFNDLLARLTASPDRTDRLVAVARAGRVSTDTSGNVAGNQSPRARDGVVA